MAKNISEAIKTYDLVRISELVNTENVNTPLSARVDDTIILQAIMNVDNPEKQYDMIEFLLNLGADANATMQNKSTVLWLSTTNGTSSDTFDLLLRKGAELTDEILGGYNKALASLYITELRAPVIDVMGDNAAAIVMEYINTLDVPFL